MRIAVDARVLSLPEARGIAGYLMEILQAWPEKAVWAGHGGHSGRAEYSGRDGGHASFSETGAGSVQDEFVLFSENPIPAERCQSSVPVSVQLVPSVKGSRVHVWDWFCLPRALRKANELGGVSGNSGFDLFWTPANVTLPVRGIPQVTTVHDTIVQECMDVPDRLERFFLHTLQPLWTRRYSTRVVTVSEFSRQRIHAVFGVPQERISVVYNGATFAEAPFASREEAMRFLVSEGIVERPFVLAFGAESAWKNTSGVIAAFEQVARERDDVDLVLAGIQPRSIDRFAALVDGTDKAGKAGIRHRVKLLPFMERRVRDALYQAAEVFVYASLFEGFGLPPLESMATDTPVVASHAASIPEVVGEAALQVDARDFDAMAQAILRVLHDEALRERLVAAGRDNITRFQWADAAAKHQELFVEVAR